LQHIYRDLHKKLQANKKKSKEIAQFIGVYIKSSKEFTKKIAKKLGQSPGVCPDSLGLETTHVMLPMSNWLVGVMNNTTLTTTK